MTTIQANPTASTPQSCGLSATTCAHCDLPVPRGLIDPAQDRQFCCDGCRTVFAIVHDHNLDRYYPLRRQLEKSKARATPSARSYEEFDDPAFLERYTTDHADSTRTATLLLEGVHCAACVWLIEKLPMLTRGVLRADLDMRASTLTLRYDPQTANLSNAARTLASLGYRPHPPRGVLRDQLRAAETRTQLMRLAVAGAIAGNTMLLALALYAGMLEGISEPMRHTLRLYSAALGLLALAWPGRVFFASAIAAVRTRTPHLDIPVALALAVGGLWGTANTLRGTGEIYFDSLTALVFLLLVGRFLQHRQQRKAADALELLFTLTPTTVRLVDEHGSVTARPIEAAQAGDTAEILPGQTVPADGVITRGASTLDNALLTGESTPAVAREGDTVHAGATNLSGTLRVRIQATGEHTRVAQLMKLVEQAGSAKPAVVQFADRIAGRFVVIVASLAAITAIAWAFIEPGLALEHATALLVITCPCALGLATPLVFTSTLARLARRSILVKGGAALERLAHARTAFLDKTGTLTTGSLRVSDWTGPDTLKPLVAAAEAGATHPIALALQSLTTDTHEQPVHAVTQHEALGLTATTGDQTLTIGSRDLMAREHIHIPPDLLRWADDHAATGATPVFVALGQRASAAAAVSGDLRPDAPALVAELTALGLDVAMLTGDRPDTATAVARLVGIAPDRVLASATPEDKLARVESTPDALMLGDGVNDAAALAAAHVGIAVGGGAEASLQAADLYIGDDSLHAVHLAVRASRAALARIRLCLFVSLAYNTVAATLAVLGHVHPLLAAVLMPASSLSVLALATARPAWARKQRPCP